MPTTSKIVTAFLLSVVCVSSRGLSQTSACRPLDEMANYMLTTMMLYATSTDPAVVASRTTNQIPATSAANVTYVTDSRTCARAASAFAGAFAIRDSLNVAVPKSGIVYVVKIGSVYVVRDPTQVMGDRIITVVLSNTFKVLAKYMS